eukprot:g35863.t1
MPLEQEHNGVGALFMAFTTSSTVYNLSLSTQYLSKGSLTVCAHVELGLVIPIIHKSTPVYVASLVCVQQAQSLQEKVAKCLEDGVRLPIMDVEKLKCESNNLKGDYERAMK